MPKDATSIAVSPRHSLTADARKGLATLPAVAAALDRLESTVGGRDNLVTILSGAPLDDSLAQIVGAIADPRMDARNLSTVCRHHAISIFDVYEALKRGIYAEATIKAMAIIAERTPPLIDDIMTRAAPHSLPCGDCHGTGTRTNRAKPDAAPDPCETCGGTGQVTIYPTPEQQKLGLSISPLAPKSQAQTDARTQTQINVNTAPDSFARLLALTDRPLPPAQVTITPADDPIEGETV